MNAIYARQSLDRRDSLSIETQVEACRAYAGEDAAVYRDRGFSGKNIKRPAFSRLLEDMRAGRVQTVCVYRLDRFSRSIADFSRLWELMARCGVEFHSVTESFDTATPMGRAMLYIVLVFAQLERETTAERVRDNYAHRVRLGEWPGGPAPYGFRLARIDCGGRRVSTLEADERAEAVRQIFARYAEPGVSLRALARELTEKGIPGPQRRVWDGVTLSRLLHSPLYARADEEVRLFLLGGGADVQGDPSSFDGVRGCNLVGRRGRTANKFLPYGGLTAAPALHEGLVDASLWLTVQEKLRTAAQIADPAAGVSSWLTGLLRCASCGYAVKVSRVKGRRYLSCSGRSNLGVCGERFTLDIDELEEAVAARITALFDVCAVPMTAPDRSRAEEALAIERRIARLVAALEAGGESRALTGRIEELERERDALLAESPRCVRMPAFGSLDIRGKRLVAAELIERIALRGDIAEIFWRI